MKKLLTGLLITLLLALAATSIVAQDAVELTFVNWIGAEEAFADDLAAMIGAFEAQNPNITIKSVSFPFNQSKDQLIVMSTGGTPPDISMSHPTWVAPLVDAGVLAPLDDLLLNQDDYFAGTFEGKYYDGKLMAVTWAPSPIIIYYNIDLLTAAGYDGPPETWAELFEAAAAIAALGEDDEGNTIYGMGISSQPVAGAGYFFLPYMWNAGGEYQDADGNIIINSPENVAALEQAKAAFDAGVSPAGLEIRDLRNLFAQGLVGFHWDGEFGVSIFAGLSEMGADFADHYGIMLIPGLEPGEPGLTFFVEHDLVIYKDSPHQEEAALFMDFLTGPEGMALYNENGGAKLPARASVSEIDFYSDPANDFMNIFIEAMEIARPMPANNAAFLGSMEEIGKALQRLAIAGDEPAVVAEELDVAVKGLYGQ
jgi:multiple sugar transport system substrate-binding protein